MRRGILVSACLLAAGSGCELQEISLAEPEDIVVVEAILRAGESIQKVLIHRTWGLGPPPPADVSVTDTAGQERAFTLVSADTCLVAGDSLPARDAACYVASEVPGSSFVRPGATYALRVETADGRVLAGATRVPGEFTIVRPSDRPCHLRADTVFEVVWTSAADAWVYVAETELSGLRDALAARGIRVPADPLRLVGLSIARDDTTIAFPSGFGLFDRFDDDLGDALVALQRGLPPAVRADLVIGAADRNYVNWVRGGNFNPSGTVRVPSVHGDRGTGVFGSVVTRQARLITAAGPNRPPC